jgi:hypothetical protein
MDIVRERQVPRLLWLKPFGLTVTRPAPLPSRPCLQTLEKALSKHEIIGVRALAQRMKSGGTTGSSRGSSPSAGSSSGSSSPGVHKDSSSGGSPGAGSRVVQGKG